MESLISAAASMWIFAPASTFTMPGVTVEISDVLAGFFGAIFND